MVPNSAMPLMLGYSEPAQLIIEIAALLAHLTPLCRVEQARLHRRIAECAPAIDRDGRRRLRRLRAHGR
jgi:hypothetical protein